MVVSTHLARSVDEGRGVLVERHREVVVHHRGEVEVGDEVVLAALKPDATVAIVVAAVAARNLQAGDGAEDHAPAVERRVGVEDAHVAHPAVRDLVEMDRVVAGLLLNWAG